MGAVEIKKGIEQKEVLKRRITNLTTGKNKRRKTKNLSKNAVQKPKHEAHSTPERSGN